MMKIIFKVCCILLALAVISCSDSGRKTEVTTGELTNHIKYLSSDSLKGRLTGSAGDSLAAVYIKGELEAYGLVPLSGDGFERFKVNDKVTVGTGNLFSVNGTSFNVNADFAPTSFSENASLKAGVVFAGYGFVINNDSVKWDDYKGLDVKNKWVMILRSNPEPDKQVSKFSAFSGDRNKVMVAKDLGAAGVLLVSGQVFDNSDTFDGLAKGDNSTGIPVFRIKRSVADEILTKSKQNIIDLEKKINSTGKPAGFLTGSEVEGKSEIVQSMAGTRNVVMVLPGEDPNLKNEYLILGAHYDHLGMGGPGSGSRAIDTVGVHHGADDNASGVAMIIELAGKFAGTKNSHKRSLIFMAFTGEEEGLLGSKHFADNPMIDLKKVDAMLNMDMVGRLKETKDFTVGGVGTATGLKEKAESLNDTAKLKLTFAEEGQGASDFSAFYAKNIPVLYFTSGGHGDYHTPSDTWDKINYEGMIGVSDLIFKITSGLANDTTRLQFKEAGPQMSANAAPRMRGITLGIMPDFTGNSKNGLRVDAVTPGKPAAAGGMKKLDIIVNIDGKSINNIQDYMFRMSQLKAGQKIDIDVMREGKKVTLKIQL